MPIYEYQCGTCHHQFDLMQKISDEPIKECPKCGKNTVTKLVSASGFQLKGSGWYATDFKDKSKVPENSSASSTNKTTDAAKSTSNSSVNTEASKSSTTNQD